MVRRPTLHHAQDPAYDGRILHGRYSQVVQERVAECCEHFRALEKIGHPTISYMSAWKEGGVSIWYEFVSKHLLEILQCDPTEVAGVFRKSVVDLRLYSNRCLEIGVMKRVIDQRELRAIRQTLREEAKKAGYIEAIYKISLSATQTVWLKDQAVVENYPQDQVCLSIGCLTVVSKEMEAEEEQEKLVLQLREDLGRIRKTIIQGQFL
jgi:hypothetical protein